MKCVRLANAINNSTIVNTFKSDNSNISYIQRKHCKSMSTITNRILKIKLMLKKPILTDKALLLIITLKNINSKWILSQCSIYENYLLKLIFISFKRIFIKIICHLLYNFISSVVDWYHHSLVKHSIPHV